MNIIINYENCTPEQAVSLVERHMAEGYISRTKHGPSFAHVVTFFGGASIECRRRKSGHTFFVRPNAKITGSPEHD